MAASWKQVRRNRNRIQQSAAAAMLLLCFAWLMAAPPSRAQPPAVEMQQAEAGGEPAIDTSAAFALTRPVIDSLWEPIAWPMRHIELEGLVKRLGLTHEQMIAVERLHAAYFDDATAKRLATIDALTKLDPDAMRIPNVIAPVDDVKKAISIRRAWHATLSGLEGALFAQIGGVLDDVQAAKLPRESARRERARYATDGWLGQWFAYGWNSYGSQLPPRPPIFEIADVIDAMSLGADSLAAIEGIVAANETALTRQVRSVFDAACESRERLIAIPHRLFTPPYNEELGQGLAIVSEAVKRLIILESECVERIAAALPADTARMLMTRYLRTAASDSIDGMVPHESNYAIALAREDLTPAERERIEEWRDAARLKADAALPGVILRSRLFASDMIRIGGGNHLVEDRYFSDDIQAILAPGQTRDELLQLSRESYDNLRTLFGRERFREVNAEMNRPSMEGRDRRRDAEFSPASNFMGQGEHFSPGQALPRSPGASDVAIVLARLALDDGSQAIIRTLNDDRATAWQAALAAAQRDISAPQQKTGSGNDPEVTKAAFARYRQAIEEFTANEALFADSLRAALEGLADDAVNLLTLARTWTHVTSAPPRVPPPLGKAAVVGGIAMHLDRVSAVHVLMGLDVPMDRLAPGIAVIAARTPGVLRASDAYRRAVVEAIEAGDLEMIRMRTPRAPDVLIDPEVEQAIRQRQANAAMAARQARLDVIRIMREMHKEVGAALDTDAAELYRRAVQRIAFPSATNGIDPAVALFDRAATLPDVDTGQQQRLAEAGSDFRHAAYAEADAIESLIADYAATHDYTPEAEAKCAGIYARLEHAMFIKDERCAAAIARIRPILSAAQCEALLNPRSVQP